MRAAFCAARLALALGLLEGPASAFVKDCHASITTEALVDAEWPLGRSAPPLEGDYLSLIDEVSVTVEPSAQDLWSLGVLLGNQYNDQGPFARDDLTAIAERAARPEAQPEHCLRRSEDNGESGDESALAACKAYILDEIGIALGDGDEPDLDTTETVRFRLIFRGKADVPLPVYAFHLGHAVHAFQDSFTHTFRTADGHKVRSVLNWVDWIQAGGYDEERDGFQHLYALDSCGAPDPGAADRRAAAVKATGELLRALGDDRGGRDGRLRRVEAVIDDWFELEGGCSAANDWCDAPERDMTAFTGCAVGGATTPPAGALVVLLLGGALILRRRRALGFLPLAALLLGAPAALAQSQPDKAKGEVEGHLVPTASPAEQRVLATRPWGVLIKTGIGIDKGAGEFGLGLRYDIDRRWTIGIGGQWSPWYSIDGFRTQRGTADAFFVGVFRFNVRDYLELRITAAAGVSVLLFDTWSAPAGSVGPYFELSPLGAAFKMNSRLRLVVDPAELVIPVPQTRGIPLVYRQHRFSVALQSNF